MLDRQYSKYRVEHYHNICSSDNIVNTGSNIIMFYV